jgi:hypothetical protein
MRVIGLTLRKPTWSDLVVVLLTLAIGALGCELLVEQLHFAPRTSYVLMGAAFGSAIASSFGVSLKEGGLWGLIVSVSFSALVVYLTIWLSLLMFP